MLLELFKEIVSVCSGITVVIGFVVFAVKPFRSKLLGTKRIEDGQRCLLRSEMLRVYYANKDNEKIRQYAYENFEYCYKAYKELGGNSFVDHIKREVDTWEIVT